MRGRPMPLILLTAAALSLVLWGAAVGVSKSTKAERGTHTAVDMPTPPPDCEVWQVIYVRDGDSIDVERDGHEDEIRFIGIDAPARTEPYADEARAIARELLNDELVCATRDVSDRGPFERMLRFVWRQRDGLFINGEMVRLGLAKAYPYPPDTTCEDLFEGLQQEAMANRVGLWMWPRLWIPAAGRQLELGDTEPCVDVNTASKEQLMTIWSVYDWVADDIIEHRPYSSFEDLLRAPAVDEVRLSKMIEDGKMCGFDEALVPSCAP